MLAKDTSFSHERAYRARFDGLSSMQSAGRLPVTDLNSALEPTVVDRNGSSILLTLNVDFDVLWCQPRRSFVVNRERG